MKRETATRLQLLLGTTLLLLFLLQYALRWHPPGLVALQKVPTYRWLSGGLLALLLAVQGWLSVVRRRGATGQRNVATKVERHVWIGLLAVPLLWLHSMRLGHAYLSVLAGVFLLNAAIGLGAPRLVSYRAPAFRSAWTLLHVGLSFFLFLLTAYHVGVALAFN